MCLAVTGQLHFGKNDEGLLHAAVVTGGGTDAKIKSAQKADPGKEFSCWDSNPQPFNQESGTLTTELSLFPVSTLTMAMLQSRPSSRT